MPRVLTLGTLLLVVTAGLLVLSSPAQAAKRPSADDLRDRILVLVNRARDDAGCRPVTRSRALQRAAQKHTGRMMRARTMSHRLRGEAPLARRVERAGYRHWRRIGENVAYGYPTARTVMRAWMHSPPHRANILDCAFRHLGVGVSRSTKGTTWYTQDFGRQ